MADGRKDLYTTYHPTKCTVSSMIFNEARAMRVAEIMSDFRNLQNYIAHTRVSPSAEEYYLQGYALVRQCVAEAQAVLALPFRSSLAAPGGNAEREKAQLQDVITDASVRRFQCQKSYLRLHSALRWINSRNALLNGHGATQAHLPILHQIDQQLQAELAAITDEHVDWTLRAQDVSERKWLDEDPPLATIQYTIRNR